jgi:hypothetical protein
MPTSFAPLPSSPNATKANLCHTYGHLNDKKVMTTSTIFSLAASTLPRPTTAYRFTAAATRPTTASPTACISSATCPDTHNLSLPHTLPLKLLSVSPSPAPYTPFPTASTLALTSPGSQRRGLRLTGNAPHSTLRLTPSFGASPSVASGLCPPHSHCTHQVITSL